MRVQALSNSSYHDRLVKHYGVTGDPRLGGFILPGGMFLDFSEGSGGRSQDHRNITWASVVKEKPHECRYDVMARICERAKLLRWMPEVWSVEMWTLPTRDQFKTLRELAEFKSMLVEAFGGGRHFYREYESYEANAIRRDLLNFYGD